MMKKEMYVSHCPLLKGHRCQHEKCDLGVVAALVFLPDGRSPAHPNSPGADIEHLLESSFLWALQPLKCLKSFLTLQNASHSQFIPVGLATKGDVLLIPSGETLCL